MPVFSLTGAIGRFSHMIISIYEATDKSQGFLALGLKLAGHAALNYFTGGAEVDKSCLLQVVFN